MGWKPASAPFVRDSETLVRKRRCLEEGSMTETSARRRMTLAAGITSLAGPSGAALYERGHLHLFENAPLLEMWFLAVESGCNDLETEDYENVTIHRFRHRCRLPNPEIEGQATITRKRHIVHSPFWQAFRRYKTFRCCRISITLIGRPIRKLHIPNTGTHHETGQCLCGLEGAEFRRVF